MSKFVAGQSGNPSGRPPGIKNFTPPRNRITFDVGAKLLELGCDPFVILAEIAMHGEKEKERCNAASQLAKYVAPQLKSIEVRADADNPYNVTLIMGNVEHKVTAHE